MAYRAICVALLLSTVPLAGCGTIGNLARPGPPVGGGKVPFGGVQLDQEHIQQASAEDSKKRLLWVADLPLSLIGDVVTWPYTATYTYINESAEQPALAIAGPPQPGAPQPPLQPGTPIPTPKGTSTTAPPAMLPPPTPVPPALEPPPPPPMPMPALPDAPAPAAEKPKP
jgi:uncharacterized protein YceK